MIPYNRISAAEYARRWAFSRNPAYFDFTYLGGDCTNFASQCIYAGALIMNYTPVKGWYYIDLNRRAPAWTGVEELYSFLVNNKGQGPVGSVVPLYDIEIGDVVQIKFSGADRFGHSPVVIDKGRGTPDTVMVAAHTNDAYNRPLSSYGYEQLRPVHILGVNDTDT